MSSSTRRWLSSLLLVAAVLLLLAGLRVAGPSAAAPPHATAGSARPSQTRSDEPTGTAPSRTRPAAVSGLLPARLIVPKIGVSAPILALDPDPSGAMQAPQTGGPTDPIWGETYWWDVGAKPGENGNAAIAGHVNRPDGSAATFTHLNALVPGDSLLVQTSSGRVMTFLVTAKDTPLIYIHGGNDPTVQRIFGPSMVPHLNLLTCWGEWDGHDYNRRLVVYSTLVGPSPFPETPGHVAVNLPR